MKTSRSRRIFHVRTDQRLLRQVERQEKGLCVLSSPALCFNHGAHYQPRKPKQMLEYYLTHRRFTHCVPVATQQARLARWWKDQACRWTDRLSRGAWLCENWASLRLTLIVERSPLQRIFSTSFLT